MSNIFEDMGKFFDGLGKSKTDQPKIDLPEVEDIDGEYIGSKRIITIPGMIYELLSRISFHTYFIRFRTHHYARYFYSKNNEDGRAEIILQSIPYGATKYARTRVLEGAPRARN